MGNLYDDYKKFMDWFKTNHPALHKKFGRNICLPCKQDGGIGVTALYKISQQDQERIFNLAQCYYEEVPVEIFDTVEFIYKPGVKKELVAETPVLNIITENLRPLINQVNRQEGKLRITFLKSGFNTWIENVSEDILQKAKELGKEIEAPYNTIPASQTYDVREMYS